MKFLNLIFSLTLMAVAIGCSDNDPFERGTRTANQVAPSPSGKTGGGSGSANLSPEDDFNKTILPLIQNDCMGCHDDKAPTTYDNALMMIVPGDAANSKLYKIVTGNGHSDIWEATSDEAKKLAAWINSITN